VIKDCWGYGLKQMARAMHKHKAISEEAKWPDHQIDNGLACLVALLLANEWAAASHNIISLSRLYLVILLYNKKDVQNLHEILDSCRRVLLTGGATATAAGE
jgi:hypothetical protein